MSHYPVLVIGDDVDGQLAPYHEFECTGEDDQFIQAIHVTDEYRKRYETGVTTRWRNTNGRLCPDWKKGRVPVEVLVKEIYSFRDYCETHCGLAILGKKQKPDLKKKHKFGWCRIDANGDVLEIVTRTNPDAKWDWYEVGGRWDGYFRLKPGVVSEANEEDDIANRTANIEPQVKALLTNMLEGGDVTLEDGVQEKRSNTSNRCLKRNVDIETMRLEAANEAREYWRKCAEVIRGETWIPWPEVLKKPDYPDRLEHYRTFYWSQPPIDRLQKANLLPLWGAKPDELLGITEEEYVEDAINGALAPYAFVRDSKWTALGEVGYWGLSRDDMSSREWNKKFREMFDDLPDDTLLTLIDCHI